MNFRQKYSLEALRRVQGFLDTNSALLGTVNASGARKELDDVVVQLSTHGVNQDMNKVGAQGTTSKLGALRNTLRRTNMRPIAQVAKVRLRTVPEFSSLTLPDPKIDTQGLIAAAEAMAKAAAAYQDTFTGLGLAPDFVAQLQAAATAVQAAVDGRGQYKISGVGATAGASSEIQRGRHAVDLLDSLVAPQLVNNDQVLAEWRNAKRVVNKPGVVPASSTPKPAAGAAGSPGTPGTPGSAVTAVTAVTAVPTPTAGSTSTSTSAPATAPATTASPVSETTKAA